MENTNVVVMMTEEQVVVLRKQIAAYAVISEQLVDFHNRFSAAIAQQQDFCFYPSLSSASPPEAGMVFESPNSEALAASGEHRVMSRQRWSPSPTQLQILENYFSKGGNAPSKGRILEITSELEKYGDVKTCNVYNWFQNRRARSKRKLQSSKPTKKTAESEADHKKRKKAKNVASAGSHGNNSTSSEGNRAQMPTSQSCENIPERSEESCSQTSEIISSDAYGVHLDVAAIPSMASPNRDVKSSGSVVRSLFDEQGARGSSDFDGDCDYYGLIF